MCSGAWWCTDNDNNNNNNNNNKKRDVCEFDFDKKGTRNTALTVSFPFFRFKIIYLAAGHLFSFFFSLFI